MVGHFPQAIICIDISCPYITPATNVYYPCYKLTTGESHAAPTLMQFRNTACQEENCDHFFRVQCENWEKWEITIWSHYWVLSGSYFHWTRLKRTPITMTFLRRQWRRWWPSSWWCWWRQWSSVGSWPYIRQVGKKHDCRHFPWQSEGCLLFPYDGRGNMLIVQHHNIFNIVLTTGNVAKVWFITNTKSENWLGAQKVDRGESNE